MLSETTLPHAEVTIRFDGLTAAQVAAVHEAVKNARTDIHTIEQSKLLAGSDTDGGNVRFAKVTKSEMKGEDGKYAVLLTLTTLLIGCVHPSPNDRDRRYATVQPSRKTLNAIWDAAGVFPSEEIVTDYDGPSADKK